MPVLFGAGATWAGITGASATTTDIPMGAARKLDWGSAAGTATVTSGSNQILNTANGPVINCKTSDYIQIAVAGVPAFGVGYDGTNVSSNKFYLGVNSGTTPYILGYNDGNLYFSGGTFVVTRVAGGEITRTTSAGLDLSTNSKKVIFGSSGTATTTNREIVGTATGLVSTVPSGLAHAFNEVGSTCWFVSSSLIYGAIGGTEIFRATSTGITMASGKTIFGDSIRSLGASNVSLTPQTGTANYAQICGHTGADGASGAQVQACGNTFTYAGYVRLVPGAVSGSRTEFYAGVSNTHVADMTLSGLDLSPGNTKVIFGSAGSVTAANREIVGTSTGQAYNVPTTLAHNFQSAGVSNATFGYSGASGNYSDQDFSLGRQNGSDTTYAFIATNSSYGIRHNAKSGAGHDFRIAGTSYFSVSSSAISAFANIDLSTNSTKVIFGSAGSVTSTNREIVGTSLGLAGNVPTGKAYDWQIAGTSRGYIDENWLWALGAQGIQCSGAGGAKFTATAGSMDSSYPGIGVAEGGYGNNWARINSPNGIIFTVASGTERARLTSSVFGLADAVNISAGTTTGTKFLTSASQKGAFWGATPVVQPTSSITGATRVGGGGTTVTDTDTFGGYTIAKVVAALQQIGLLA